MTRSSRSPPRSPERLWRAWRSRGDERAFADLVSGQGRYAADLARRAGASSDEAEDAVQDALIRLAKEPSDEPVDVGIRAWLCRRVVLGVKMRARSEGRRRRREQSASPRVSPSRPADGAARAADAARAVDAHLRELAPGDRTAVLLRRLYGMSYGEVAFILGITEGACRTRVHRAMARLRQGAAKTGMPAFAVLAVPALVREGALLTTATSASTASVATTAGVGTGVAGWKLAVGGAAAACAISAAVLLPDKAGPPPAPPPVVVVVEEPVADEPPAPVPQPAAPAPVPAPVRTSPALAFLAAHLDTTRDETRTMWDANALRALFPAFDGPAHVIEATARETPLDLARLARDGRPIVLGEGVFRVTHRVRRAGDKPIQIVGAGSERTTLIAPDGSPIVRPNDELPWIVLRDLTLDGQGIHIDVRVAGLFERVRFRGWVDTAGYGAPVGVSGEALLLFRECTFVGGHRHRADGSALAVRGSTLALFDRCHFADLDYALGTPARRNVSGRSMVHLLDCFFDGPMLCHPGKIEATGVPHYAIRVRGGRAAALAELHSQRQRMTRFDEYGRGEIDGLRYVPATYRSTLTELRAVLAGCAKVKGEHIVGVESLAWLGVPERIFAVHSYGPRRTLVVRLWRLTNDDRCVPADDDAARIPRRLPFRPGSSLDLAALLDDAWPDLPADALVAGIAIHRNTSQTSLLYAFDRYLDQIPLDRLAAPRPR